MNDYIHEICLLLLCGIFAATQTESTFAIAGMLLSIIVICIQSSDNRTFRILAAIIFSIASCFSLGLLSFLPLIAYTSMHDRSWAVRAIWLFPICLQIVLGDTSLFELSASKLPDSIKLTISQPLIWIIALCVIGCALGIKDARRESEYKGLQRAYDLLKEQTLITSAAADITMGPENAITQAKVPKTSEDISNQPTNSKAYGKAATREARKSAVYQSSFFEGLTERELAVVSLVAEGMDNREISQKLFLSEGTVRNHISSILSKKDLHNRTQIAVMYYRG